MSIVIEKILEEKAITILAILNHDGSSFTALMNLTIEEARSKVGEELMCEMSYESIEEFEILSNFDDAQSTINDSDKNPKETIIIGRIHNAIEVNDQESIIDIYLQKGPEFLAISS